MKKRYLVQRLDDQRFFCHPTEAGEFTQWTKDTKKAHKWVDLDSCLEQFRPAKWSGEFQHK